MSSFLTQLFQRKRSTRSLGRPASPGTAGASDGDGSGCGQSRGNCGSSHSSWRLSVGPSRRASRSRTDETAACSAQGVAADDALRAWLAAAGAPPSRSVSTERRGEGDDDSPGATPCSPGRHADATAGDAPSFSLAAGAAQVTASCSFASSVASSSDDRPADAGPAADGDAVGAWAGAGVEGFVEEEEDDDGFEFSAATEGEEELYNDVLRLLADRGLPQEAAGHAAACCARLLLSSTNAAGGGGGRGSGGAPSAATLANDAESAVVRSWLSAPGIALRLELDGVALEDAVKQVLAAVVDVRTAAAAQTAAMAAGPAAAAVRPPHAIGLSRLGQGQANNGGGRGSAEDVSDDTESGSGGGGSRPLTPRELAAAARALLADAANACYGQLVVLGYREFLVRQSMWHPVGRTGERLVMRRRAQANGLKLIPPLREEEQAAADCSGGGTLPPQRANAASHVIHLQQLPQADGEGEARVLYGPDENTDLFQLGRLVCTQNDFVVRGPLHQSAGGKVCGPVSRYALRISCVRKGPNRGACRLFAGGFGAGGSISLAEGCPKWRAPAELGGWDGATTFGVRFWKPEVGNWREVTVNGAVHEPRVDRLDVVGPRCEAEDNILTDGTVVDIGGIQLLFESGKRMATSAAVCPDEIIDQLRRLRPQCPVMMHTIRFDTWEDEPAPDAETAAAAAVAANAAAAAAAASGAPEVTGAAAAAAVGGILVPGAGIVSRDAARAPWVFPACGHVHSYAPELAAGPCPMCRKAGPFTPALFQWLPAIDKELPTVVFNPCGHVASEAVARFWSLLPLPNNAPPDAIHRPVCPHCAKPLRTRPGERPFSRIVWQAEEAGSGPRPP